MLKNKRILYLVKTMNLGGAERFTVDLAKSFNKDFASVAVASSGGEYEKLLKVNGIRHIKLKEEQRISNLICMSKELHSILNEENFDIVHTQHRILQFALQLIPGKKTHNVYTSHNLFNDIYSKMIFPDRAVAISPIITKNLSEQSLMNKSRISTINCCTEIMPYKEVSFHSPLTFGFIGRLIEEKGIYLLLEAAALLKTHGYKFKIIYRGAGDSLNLGKAIIDKSLNDEIVILPFTTDSNQIFDEIDVLVLPSWFNEGLPLSILEAASRQKLIITSNAGGTADFIRQNHTGLMLDNLSPEALSALMQKLIESPDEYKPLINNAYKEVKENYSIQSTHQKYLELYKDLLGETS